ncbi:hypothetical protein B0H10DRAFT_2079865 [Mycena sp. CBHHK59/15]|nr:hypothetical protein B0H10DRAFT_2079865 [Mycena sp. CBHHK59/15]
MLGFGANLPVVLFWSGHLWLNGQLTHRTLSKVYMYSMRNAFPNRSPCQSKSRSTDRGDWQTHVGHITSLRVFARRNIEPFRRSLVASAHGLEQDHFFVAHPPSLFRSLVRVEFC